MTTPTVDALVLAAGSSSRLGQPKQRVCLHGVTLLERMTRLALSCVDGEVHVVLGCDAPTLLPLLEKLAARPHIYTQWGRGQSASLAFGLDKIGPGRAVLVLLVDQYRLTSEHLAGLIRAWRAAPQAPAAAFYAGTGGVPVLWPPHYVNSLRAAPRGQSLLDPSRCTLVPLADAAYDLDTPEHLLGLREFERAPVG